MRMKILKALALVLLLNIGLAQADVYKYRFPTSTGREITFESPEMLSRAQAQDAAERLAQQEIAKEKIQAARDYENSPKGKQQARIFNNCVIDNMPERANKSLQTAVGRKCLAMSKDPSYLDKLLYDHN